MEADFFKKVYTVTKLIPKGRVTTYGLIAKILGSGKSARIIGWALNNCPDDVPAHRVVNKNGLLTGKMHFNGVNTMACKLMEEGIKIKDNGIVNFKEILWKFE